MPKDKRREETDQEIWSTILKCYQKHKDDLPLSAYEVVRSSKVCDAATINRDRGGLNKFVSSYREEMLSKIEALVVKSSKQPAIYYSGFFFELARSIADYKHLLELEITLQRKIGLVEEIVKIIQPVLPKGANRESLVALFFLTLDMWAKTGFKRNEMFKVQNCLVYAAKACWHRSVSFIDLRLIWSEEND